MAAVFVGIPTINRPRMVRETLLSVLGQTFGDLMIVVSDNGSEAGSVHAVREFVKSLGDDRVRFHLQAENEGEYGQARYFLRCATDCEYFVMLHDDDLMEPEYLEIATATLTQHPELELFVGNPRLIDEGGAVSEANSAKYLSDHARDRHQDGPYSVLERHLESGFTPISGTFFRTSALQKSGLAESGATGNYPFECDVFLRLGDQGAQGWFCSESLLRVRFHRSSMRNYMNMMENPTVVTRMIEMFANRRYSGKLERQRKTILGRLYREYALICARLGDMKRSRSNICKALGENVLSVKSWLAAPWLILVPGLVRAVLPKLPESFNAPAYQNNAES